MKQKNRKSGFTNQKTSCDLAAVARYAFSSKARAYSPIASMNSIHYSTHCLLFIEAKRSPGNWNLEPGIWNLEFRI